jgi:hypothetical protein
VRESSTHSDRRIGHPNIERISHHRPAAHSNCYVSSIYGAGHAHHPADAKPFSATCHANAPPQFADAKTT